MISKYEYDESMKRPTHIPKSRTKKVMVRLNLEELRKLQRLAREHAKKSGCIVGLGTYLRVLLGHKK